MHTIQSTIQSVLDFSSPSGNLLTFNQQCFNTHTFIHRWNEPKVLPAFTPQLQSII